jgi:ANTAR domain/GAF domain
LDVTGGPGADERTWSAGERDSGADERDRIADGRDAAADQRDQQADAWEAELDQREARLYASSRDDRAHDRVQREAARTERAEQRSARDAAAARSQAGHRRIDPPAADVSGHADGERAWATDKRDFVADERDRIADEREAAADLRDQQADAWEAELDEREARLGSGPGNDGERARRKAARTEREQQRAARAAAATARGAATRRRLDGAAATGLATAFAEIARHLYDAEDLDDVLTRIADVSVSAVPGCEMASITVRDDDGAFRTVAATHQAATAVDQAQQETGEGPGLAAVTEAVVYTPEFPDPRWPGLGSRPADAGVHSAVSYSLVPARPAADPLLTGSLNAYAGVAHAFDDESREIGLILAAHASIAVRAVGERSVLEQLGHQLHDALASRDVIGQAKGILMERLRITPEDAFDTLRRSSQRLNVKLREIAQKLAETGELDDAG